jgi:hypothetical protein
MAFPAANDDLAADWLTAQPQFAASCKPAATGIRARRLPSITEKERQSETAV